MRITLPEDRLEATPSGSRWGRNVQLVYLGVVAVAFVALLVEMSQGHSGVGAIAVSVLTAPWSGLLAMLARALGGALAPDAMRVVGLLLVAALLVLPIATARLLARSFRATLLVAVGVGVVAVIVGLGVARVWGLAPGGTIVLVTIAAFAVTSVARPSTAAPTSPHDH